MKLRILNLISNNCLIIKMLLKNLKDFNYRLKMYNLMHKMVEI